ncbi:cytochrome c biogenesis protein ResB [Tessaracoccus massiliensis]|uniref:cytochrome c biogenesis protein ResB n=1 Tax=Tessaracoccus massiliensis TaxID=1522311 RepID=UPI00058E765D|nr:cytochrome c biogenesis protein ResB [Tessaracoccus massiliensis]
MSQTLEKPQPDPHIEVDDDHYAAPAKDLFRKIYRFFHNKFVGLALILAMAVLTLLGTMIAQAPPGVLQDPDSAQQWLDSIRPRFGGWTDVLNFLGFFNLYKSVPFLLVVALLTLSIIACTTHRLPLLWKRATKPQLHVTDGFFIHARYCADETLPVAPERVEAVARRALKGHHFRVLDDERGPGINLYADRYRWGPFGTALAHASFVIILMGFVVSAFWGLDTHLNIPVGTKAAVGHDTGYEVEAVSFQDAYNEDGRPIDYVSHLVLYKDGEQVAEQEEVRVNQPLRHDGVKFHQASFGIATMVRVTEGGTELYAGGVPLQWTSRDGSNSLGRFELPEKNLEVIVVTAASGRSGSTIPAGEAVFEVYPEGSNQPLAVLPAPQGTAAEAAGIEFTFEREIQFTGITVRSDPGTAWVYTGSALMVFGMFMTFILRHRRVWVRITPDGAGSRVRLGSSEKVDTLYEREFARLTAEITTGKAPQP